MKNAITLIILTSLALSLCRCSEPADVAYQVEHIRCSPGAECPDGWYCAVIDGGDYNECRPPCETDADCNPGALCDNPIDWFEDGSVEALACDRWESLGY